MISILFPKSRKIDTWKTPSFCPSTGIPENFGGISFSFKRFELHIWYCHASVEGRLIIELVWFKTSFPHSPSSFSAMALKMGNSWKVRTKCATMADDFKETTEVQKKQYERKSNTLLLLLCCCTSITSINFLHIFPKLFCIQQSWWMKSARKQSTPWVPRGAAP